MANLTIESPISADAATPHSGMYANLENSPFCARTSPITTNGNRISRASAPTTHRELPGLCVPFSSASGTSASPFCFAYADTLA